MASTNMPDEGTGQIHRPETQEAEVWINHTRPPAQVVAPKHAT